MLMRTKQKERNRSFCRNYRTSTQDPAGIPRMAPVQVQRAAVPAHVRHMATRTAGTTTERDILCIQVVPCLIVIL